MALKDGHSFEALVNKVAGCLRDPTSAAPVIEGLSPDESAALIRGLSRLRRLGEHCRDRGLKMLVDAEYTYMNKGISVCALALMNVFNKDRVVVANTYQCYLKVKE